MKSPFPGMDPFIEACGLWEDFHDALVQDMKHGLNQCLPDRYVVRMNERAYVVVASAEGEEAHRFKLDVVVTRAAESTAAAVLETVAIEEPIWMQALVSEEFRETFVEIREVGSDRIVTYIELLSPANKKPNSEGWSLYLRKRQSIFLSRSANLIEMDLLRGGQRMPMANPWPQSPYSVLVARLNHAPLACQVYPAHSVVRIPPIPVPLLSGDADVTLDLQPLMDAIYSGDRYPRSLDYTRPLTPPLSDSEAAFLKK